MSRPSVVGAAAPAAPTKPPRAGTTQIHAFAISDPTKTTYLGSGNVSGSCSASGRCRSSEGVLRVVSTDTPAGGAPAGEPVLPDTLRPQAAALSSRPVGGLGPGDRVYAVRMIGDTGYVVTFKRVDPLYTIDLHDPAKPRLLGKLELPGYSSYLHPISDSLLLGIGQNVDAKSNEPTGTRVSLFDVSNPATRPASARHPSARAGRKPSRTTTPSSTGRRPGSSSSHSASRRSQCTSPAPGISELGRIVHDQARQSQLPQIDRSPVVGHALLTISSAGVAANPLTGLTEPRLGPVPACRAGSAAPLLIARPVRAKLGLGAE